MTDSLTRNALITGALVAAFMVAADIVANVYQFLFTAAVYGDQFSSAALYGARGLGVGTLLQLVGSIVGSAVFGAGIFVSLRWVAPVGAATGWRRVILRGVIATALGAAASLLLSIIEGLANAFGVGPHPLGYQFDPSFSVDNAHNRVVDAFGGAVSPFLTWLPLVVLAVVLLRLWLAHHEKPATVD
jgi:hypothetical protein